MNVPDNYDQWEAHERKQQAWLERLPKCEICGEPIQDEDLFLFDGSFFCLECAEYHFKKRTEDFIF